MTQLFGITERGDSSIDYTWTKNLKDGNIIISKRLTDKLIDELVNHKDKIIFHHTVTGMGGSKIEPNAYTLEQSYNQCMKLLQKGFPVNQIVLRIDPIVPTMKGIKTADKVLNTYMSTGIKRVRYSFLDMYPHVKQRFTDNNIPLPYETFNAPAQWQSHFHMLMQDVYEEHYTFESCTEGFTNKMGCVSKKDYKILGLQEPISSNANQRRGCNCLGTKTELLKNAKQCPIGCLYCYWKN